MLFFSNADISVARQTVKRNSEGSKIKGYDFDDPLETFRADVQPNVLNAAQIELYGLNVSTANTKKCFADINDGKSLEPGNRVRVSYDDGGVEYYSVQPANVWRGHREFLLIPVEGRSS